jgi:HemY protein
MRGILLFFIFAAIILGGAWWVSGLGGQVSATLAGYTIETETPVALLALAVLVILIAILLRLIFGLLDLPARISRWRARRRHAAGVLADTRALVAIAAGDAPQALKQSARARKKLGDTAHSLLHAAEAARLAGRDDEAAALYRKLADHREAGFLGLRGLFRQAVARQDWEEAARLARDAERAQPGPAWLRHERAEVAVRTGNWQQAIALAPPGAPTAAYAVAAVDAEPDADRALKLARRAYNDNPDFTPAALAYARLLRQTGKETRAQAMLHDSWTRNPHPDLAQLALAAHAAPATRYREAQNLVDGNPGHAESHFLLASVGLQIGTNESVIDARRHAEAARAAGMNQQRLYRLLADIDAADLTGATLIKPREAVRQASAADPDPGWRCEACGTALPAWSATCPQCRTAGHVGWGNTARPKLIAKPEE